VLVTAGAWVVPVGVPVAAMLLGVAGDEADAGADVMPVAAGAPPMIRLLPAGAAALVVAGAEEWVTVGDDWAGRVVGAAVVGVDAPPPPEEDTVMSAEGLPEPHWAVTTYVPGETDVEIVAVPVKFSEPMLIDAEPPANAGEVTPLSVEPLFGQTPRIETVWPPATVPGETINWP